MINFINNIFENTKPNSQEEKSDISDELNTGIIPFKFKNNYLNVFFLCLLVSFIFFIPFIIADGGYFIYYGDFNVQQIPFYTSAHEAVQNGNIFWSWTTDLGANFIASYSFYLLTSPFFWLTLLFPTSAVPFLLAPLLMIKFALAGVTSFAFIKRFTKKQSFAVLGAVMYAFCGFNIFNIFFNHFHEAVIIFPLMLVALEELVLNDRKGFFALTVFAGAFINYFFFFGQVIFVIIYFIIRAMSGAYNLNFKKCVFIGIEAVLGLLISCCVLLPSILAILSNDRVSEFYAGMDLLLYANEQKYALILQSMFFPPDIPSRPNFFANANAKWSSVSLYLPLFSLTGVLVFIKNKSSHWLKKLLTVLLVMALVPVLNSSFYAFNSSYYARWFYMPILMMSLATCLSLEDETLDFKYGIKVTSLFVAGFSLIGIVPTKDGEGNLTWFNLPKFPDRFWIYVIISVFSLVIIYMLLKIPRNSKLFIQITIILTCVITVCYSVVMIGSGKSHSNQASLIIDQGINGEQNLNMPDPHEDFYRIDTYDVLDNINMYWDIPNIQAFHSVVPTSIMEFYGSIDYDRNVASRAKPSYTGLRALTSTKYQFVKSTLAEDSRDIVTGFEKVKTENGFDIYENKHFIPMGFTYDTYVDEEFFEEYAENRRDLLMLNAVYLSDEDSVKLEGILTNISDVSAPIITDAGYFETCEEKQENAGYYFSYDTKSFTSKINMDKESLVFYSVPYEAGWSATVNGKDAEIIKANVGFMSVVAPAGDNEIVFTYNTPGLNAGIIISISALLILGAYVFMFKRKK